MASVNVTSAYVGDVVQNTVFTLATVGNQAVEKGSVHVEPGVELKLFLPRFNTEQDALQARVASPGAGQAFPQPPFHRLADRRFRSL